MQFRCHASAGWLSHRPASRSLGHHPSHGHRYGAPCWDSAGAGVTVCCGRRKTAWMTPPPPVSPGTRTGNRETRRTSVWQVAPTPHTSARNVQNVVMTAAVLALVGVFATVCATLIGHWVTRQQNLRLDSEREQGDKALGQERDQERARLRLDAAMRAADLFGPSGDESASAARSASGLLALTQLDRADLAVALLVDLWAPRKASNPMPNGRDGEATDEDAPAGSRLLTRPTEGAADQEKDGESADVSTETAIQVINAALESAPNAQLIAAELLCRNARSLDICQTLHWPESIDSSWIPELPPTAKLLIMDALVQMACANKPTKNALRSLAVRLYGIWHGDDNERVKGCVGTLMCAIFPAIKKLGYTEFMQGVGTVTIDQMEEAAASASPNPDGYLEMMLEDRSRQLREWSQRCESISFLPGALANAANAI